MTLVELRDQALELCDQYTTKSGCSKRAVEATYNNLYFALTTMLTAENVPEVDQDEWESILNSWHCLRQILAHTCPGTLILESGATVHFTKEGTAIHAQL